MDPLNEQVTAAVLRAERSLDSAIEAYKSLLSAESAVSKQGKTETDRMIAASGHSRAEVTLSVLVGLRNIRSL